MPWDLRLISNQIDPSPKAGSGTPDFGKAGHVCREEPLASWPLAHSIVAVQLPGVWVCFGSTGQGLAFAAQGLHRGGMTNGRYPRVSIIP